MFLVGSSPSAPAKQKVLEMLDFSSVFKTFSLYGVSIFYHKIPHFSDKNVVKMLSKNNFEKTNELLKQKNTIFLQKSANAKISIRLRK